jgi:hypothetical protein
MSTTICDNLTLLKGQQLQALDREVRLGVGISEEAVLYYERSTVLLLSDLAVDGLVREVA